MRLFNTFNVAENSNVKFYYHGKQDINRMNLFYIILNITITFSREVY